MKNQLVVRKCKSCGASCIELDPCTCESGCGIKCCGEKMEELEPNTFEASAEKHIPEYDLVEDEIFVKLNHPMEKEHYIEWICLVKDNKRWFTKLYPESPAEARFPYIEGSTIYAYCNKHELWSKEVE